MLKERLIRIENSVSRTQKSSKILTVKIKYCE